ncbi:MAG TPA: RdgB/HAM1 family non-canonical purine NTP pyrophosphatase [Candidatus Polarisedimenticolaceae bacterium]|nr:RdgB/HAM1 family non-canonical purine NTP pyrophosphatase [Candidatus Polarisedimenticolaceae bacterium]
MTTLVVATGNPGKIAEIAAALAASRIEVLGLPALSDTTPIDETGSTFEANARLKAEGYSLRTPHAVLADDSGLEVDALEGAPGILSARYGSPTLSDPARCKAILKALIDTPDAERTARFRCVLAVARGGRTLATFDGAVEGTILRELRGSNGFGYDPIFFHPPSQRAFGELSREEKQKVSHRGQALAKLVAAIERGEVS